MIPSEEEVNRMERYAEAVQALVTAMQELTEQNESLEDFRDILKDLQRLKLPTAGQMQAAEKHLETLQAIEELAEV